MKRLKSKFKRSMALLMCLCMLLSTISYAGGSTAVKAEELDASGGAVMTEVNDVADSAEESTSEEAAAEESAPEEAVAEESASEEAAAEESTSEEAATEESASEEEAAQESGTDTTGIDNATEEETVVGVTAASESAVSVTAAAVEESTQEEMPAVTLSGTVSGITVTVDAPEGAFAEGVEMTVEAVEGTDAEAFLDAVAEQDFSLYDETYTVIDFAILEISFYVDDEKVQPETDVIVTISGLALATEADGLDADYALVYHMDDDGDVDYVETDQNEEVGLGTYSFTASEFSTYGVVNVNVAYGTLTASVSSNAGNANHIDIGVSASASVTIGNTTYSNSNIGITSNDFTSGNVTITAVQGATTLTGSTDSSDWRRTGNNGNYTYTITNSDVDFVYNLSDLSTSSGSSGISQVRIGGCFPVGSKSNPVEYTMTLTKSVTLYANGDTSSSDYITVTVTLTATFGYWDSDNDCPGLSNNWNNGGFSSGSGFDFVLSVSSTTRPTVTVYKYVVDEDGNLLTEASGESFNYTIISTNNNVSTTESGSITVGSSGVGMATTDVTNSSNYTVTETSYPDAIGDYTYISSSVTYNGSTATITNVYGVKTIDIPVTKVWSDADYNGYRPDEIVVTLLADGTEATDSAGNTITLTLSDSNSWSGTFTDLPVNDDAGEPITYTIAENMVPGYNSSVSGSASEGFTITNTLQTGSLTLKKVVKADSSIDTSGFTFTFYVKGYNGELDNVTSVSDGTNSYSVSGGVATVTVPADGSVTLVNLPIGSYIVYETSDTTVTANSYTWTVSGDNGSKQTVTADTISAATITNTITGNAVVSITKNWDDQGNYYNTRPTNDGSTFAVTLTATGTNGEPYMYTTTATWTEGTNIWTLDLSGVKAFDTEGNMLTYTVTETEVEGYTLVEDTITVTPASDRNVSLTNTLQTASVTVTKVVLDSDGNVLESTENDDDFRFALYAYDDAGNAVSYGTVTLTAGGSYTFTDIPFGTYYLTEYLVGSHNHSYDTTVTVDRENVTVDESFDSDAQVKYHTVSFTLDEDNENKTVSVAVTNQEEEISVDLAALINGVKTLESDSDVTKAFTYTVKEASIIDGVEIEGDTAVATGTVTVSNKEPKDIVWTIEDEDAFTYDEVGTYYYVIYEDVATGTGTGGVIYDSTRYTLTITVTKDATSGGLIAAASMTQNVQVDDGTRTTTTVTSDSGATSFTAASTEADFTVDDSFTASFTNTYDVTETSIILRASKILTGRTLSEGEFSIEIQELNEEGEAIGDPVSRSNGATGAFGYEIVYTKEGTYIYKVSEAQGSLAGVDYDGHYYIVYVYVADDDGVLTVTGTDVEYYDADGKAVSGSYSFDSMTFTNTYTATGSGTISTYKVMQGRDFNAGETFTFLIEALDSDAPDLTDPDNGVDFMDNGDGTYTVTVTVPDDVADGTTVLKEVLASINVDQDNVGEWVYRVTETSASNTNGMTLDTATYGHLITVYVTDDGGGTMTVTTESTNDTDWDGDGETDTASSVIVNTFNPGTRSIYGTKVWVDGGASHDNGSEVTLTLYYSIDKTTWNIYTGDYTVTWGTLYTNDWHIENLPVYDEDGNQLYYRIEETYSNGNSYTITYGDSGSSEPETIPEDNASDNRYTITNTIVQEEVSISGTKTWVEPETTDHDNASELALIVSRNSDSTSLTNLTLEDAPGDSSDDSTYIVVWSGNTYHIYWYYDEDTQTYVGLPLYDGSGYTYSYSVAESYAPEYRDETYANYEIETDWNLISDTEVTFDFTNRAPDDDEENPAKTEDGDGAEAIVNGKTVVEYGKVAVGDEITYTINYYNNANDTATVRITDPLDSGVDFVSASYGDVTLDADDTGDATDTGVSIGYNSATHTVTWEIETAAFTSGSVIVTVQVNSSARSIVSGETAATVDNQATVYNTVTGHSATTEIVTNPLDDEDEEADKGIISVTYEDEEGNEYTRTEMDEIDNYYVHEGDEIHYIISRYNNTSESVTFVIVDTLDEGVTYTYSSYGSTYYADATDVTVGTDTYSIPARSVVWIVTTNPYSYATVQMTVTVNSAAKAATQTYEATAPGTYYDGQGTEPYNDFNYGTADTNNEITASVANQALVYTVGNEVVSYTNVVENPLKEDEPQDPTKTIVSGSAGYTEDTVKETDDEGNTVVTYGTVSVGSTITYAISYYNHNNEEVTVVITDELDDGVTFVSAGEGVISDQKCAVAADADGTEYTLWYGGTVTWELTVAPLTGGTVYLEVLVNENAGITENNEDTAAVENQASVKVGTDLAVSTNKVINPVPEEGTEEGEAEGEESTEETGSTDAVEGADSAATGDNAPVVLVISVLAVSGISLIILFFLQARKKKNNMI